MLSDTINFFKNLHFLSATASEGVWQLNICLMYECRWYFVLCENVVYMYAVVGAKKVQAGKRANAATRARRTLMLDPPSVFHCRVINPPKVEIWQKKRT